MISPRFGLRSSPGEPVATVATVGSLQAVSGLLTGVRRFSVSDGPGVRSTVLMKGCPLVCLWCDHPEVRVPHREAQLRTSTCATCGRCVDSCGEPLWDATVDDLCRDCATCASACQRELVRTVGRTCTVAEVVTLLERDQRLYQHGGGVTIGGGEPLYQHAFCLALLAACRQRGWHTALDTNGQAPLDVFEAGLAACDLVLFDLKESDLALHQRWTGSALEPIVRNLVHAAVSSVDLWVRLPVVPGANDRDDHWAKVGDMLADLPGPPVVELVPHRAIGGGTAAPSHSAAEPTASRMQQIADELQSHGLTVRRP